MLTVRENIEQGAFTAPRLAELEAAAGRDLALRSQAAVSFRLSVAQELFYFGRPLFQLLLPLGIQAVNTPAGLRLSLQTR